MSFACGDIIELAIAKQGYNGEGIAYIDNLIVFIDGAILGEKVRAKIVKVEKTWIRAKLLSIITSAKCRVQPLCDVFGRCGGCTLQHIAYDTQTKIKLESALDRLNHAGIAVQDANIVSSKESFRYRNKVHLKISKTSSGEIIVGYNEEDSHTCVDIKDCPLTDKRIVDVIAVVRKFISDFSIDVCDYRLSEKGLKYIVVRFDDRCQTVCMVGTLDTLPKWEEFYNRLSKISNTSLFYSKNISKSSVVINSKPEILRGDLFQSVKYFGTEYDVAPDSFLQVNTDVAEELYKDVIKFANLSKTDVIVDAYCGIGILTSQLAQRAQFCHGIEIVSSATESAAQHAQKHGIVNVKYHTGDCIKLLPELLEYVSNKNDDEQESLAKAKSIASENENATLKCGANLGRCDEGNCNSNNSTSCKKTIFDTHQYNLNGNVELHIPNLIAKEKNNGKEEQWIASEEETNIWEKQTNAIKEQTNVSKEEMVAKNLSCYENQLCDSESKTTSIIPKHDTSFRKIVVLDPPRKGCNQSIIQAINKCLPDKLIYISCDLQSLIPNLKQLLSSYTITKLSFYDMFPQTSHIETLICLTRK